MWTVDDQLASVKRLDLAAYVLSMATHLVALLLGGAISSLLQGEVWPAPARELRGPQVVLAVPASAVEAGEHVAGESVHLIFDARRTAEAPCSLSRHSFRLLSQGESLLLSQDVARMSPAAMGLIRRALRRDSVGAVGGPVMRISKGDLAPCKPLTMGEGDVVVDGRSRI